MKSRLLVLLFIHNSNQDFRVVITQKCTDTLVVVISPMEALEVMCILFLTLVYIFKFPSIEKNTNRTNILKI